MDALIARLEGEDADELSMEVLAADAGVSRRTLYRYFPTREVLYAAAGERIERLLKLPTEVIGGAEGISASFVQASRQLQLRPALARAMVRSRAGSAVRSPLRENRRAAIEEAITETTGALPVDEARRAAAVVAHLCSSSTWIALQEESHLSPEESRQAITWALDTLIGDLRRRQAHNQRNAS